MTRWRVFTGFLGLAVVAAAGACGSSGGGSASSSSHWITCREDSDCASIPDAVRCAEGYCVDAAERRLVAGSATVPGSGGQGGSVTGDTGGATLGGAGAATGGAVGTGAALTRCESAADCVLIADCCTCTVTLVGTPMTDDCVTVCDQDQCTGLLISEEDVVCWAGQCAVAGAEGNCDVTDVLCERIGPTCPEGYLPSVVDRCWGPCVLEQSCLSGG